MSLRYSTISLPDLLAVQSCARMYILEILVITLKSIYIPSRGGFTHDISFLVKYIYFILRNLSSVSKLNHGFPRRKEIKPVLLGGSGRNNSRQGVLRQNSSYQEFQDGLAPRQSLSKEKRDQTRPTRRFRTENIICITKRKGNIICITEREGKIICITERKGNIICSVEYIYI